MVKAKPDCTGQKFGRLLVLGKGGITRKHGSLWKLRCDCGKIIELPRGHFDRKGRGQISCGCLRGLGLVDNKRRPKDITGQRFGSLTAIALTGKKDECNQPTWLLQCDCGNRCEMSLKRINRGWKLNCGDKIHLPGSWYPPTPQPYPKEAGELLVKYLHLTQLEYQQIDGAVEDEKRDRLLRAAWIITYRRWQGEEISELHEKRIIAKHLRYCSIKVFWQRKLEESGGFLYDVSSKKREIGSTMTKLTSPDYPVLETQGIKILPIKKLKFNRR
jgi:hypothetical protein